MADRISVNRSAVQKQIEGFRKKGYVDRRDDGSWHILAMNSKILQLEIAKYLQDYNKVNPAKKWTEINANFKVYTQCTPNVEIFQI